MNYDLADLNDAANLATLGIEVHRGLVVEKGKVEARLEDLKTLGTELVNHTIAARESGPEISKLVDSQKKYKTEVAPNMESLPKGE